MAVAVEVHISQTKYVAVCYIGYEMEWYGMIFNETYQNVHQSLTAYSATSEMSILENVVPFLLFSSIVGKYKDICHSVQELLQHLQCVDHNELCYCMNVPLLKHYIYDVIDRIEAV